MKVIFLDIDGVLNSHRTVAAYGHYGFLGCRDGYHLDPVALKMLEVLCGETAASIVISSSWRIGASMAEFDELFKHYNMKIRAIDFTPRNDVMGKVRGDEIQEWLDSKPNVSRYVILDDDSDMLEHQKDSFVHVDREIGFSFKDFERAKEILTLPAEDTK